MPLGYAAVAGSSLDFDGFDPAVTCICCVDECPKRKQGRDCFQRHLTSFDPSIALTPACFHPLSFSPDPTPPGPRRQGLGGQDPVPVYTRWPELRLRVTKTLIQILMPLLPRDSPDGEHPSPHPHPQHPLRSRTPQTIIPQTAAQTRRRASSSARISPRKLLSLPTYLRPYLPRPGH